MKSKISTAIESVTDIKEKFLLFKASKILTAANDLGYNNEETQNALYEFLTIFN